MNCKDRYLQLNEPQKVKVEADDADDGSKI